MSSKEHRSLKSGGERWIIRFRHEGKNCNVPFFTEGAADSFRAMVDTLGPNRALELASAPPTVAPTVRRTVSQQVEHHINHLTGVTDGTRAKYRKIQHARLDPWFRDVLLSDLTRDHVAAWVNAQTGAPKTVFNAQALLSSAVGSAVRDGLVGTNVVKGVRPPRAAADTEEHVYLTHEEFALLSSWVPERWRLFPTFLVGTGVRFGEATALTVGHLDLPHGSAHVRQAWEDTSGGPAKLGTTKTRKSKRTIAVPPQLVDQLQDHTRGKRAAEWVFTNTRGNPIRNGVFHESVWQRLMDPFEEATGKRPRVHDLRHTFASWAIQAGIPLPVIQRQMGHESIQVTVDTYGHLARSDFDAMAVTIGLALPALPQLPPGRGVTP